MARRAGEKAREAVKRRGAEGCGEYKTTFLIELTLMIDTRIVPSSYIGSFGKKRGAGIHVNISSC